MNTDIGFIGGGNMARSIIGGLISYGWSGSKFHVSDPSEEQRALVSDIPGIHVYENNNVCVNQCGILVLAVKPQMMQRALFSIQDHLQTQKPLLISIAAGILTKDIIKWSGIPLPVVRAMPNTPALVNSGVSGLYANDLSNTEHKKTAENIMAAVGPTVWVSSETDIDTITGISGSGPAYFFKLMEIMISTAEAHGINAESAKTLVLQTALGAARLANQSDVSPAELRRRVTSPNGTTEAAIKTMEDNHIESTIQSGIQAGIDRSKELAKIFGDS